MELTQRQQRVLRSVVDGYSRTGEPVGSKAVAQELGVSSATVRNEMAGLFELGLLEQPHTSAGRVPSQRGYREYIDRLMPQEPLRDSERKQLESLLLGSAYDPESLLKQGAQLLAQTMRCAAAATTPSGAAALVRGVQFVQTGRRTALLVLLNSLGAMKTKVFRCGYDLTPDLTHLFFRVFNEKLAGKAVRDITPALAQTIAASLGEMYVLMGPPLGALLEAARDTAQPQVLLAGQMNLLLYPELEQAGMHRLLDFLEKREGLRPLLGQRPGRVTVLIGGESGLPELALASVAVARYTVEGQPAGSVAAVGPIRMDYPRLTATLSALAAQLSTLLTALRKEGQE